MKKGISIAIFLVAFTINTNAQGVERQMGTSASASQIFLEAGGLGFAYSINYDQRFKKMENGFGFRFGLGGATAGGDGYIAIPAQINYLYGNNGQYLELGAGISYISVSDIFDDGDENTVFGTATIGFRKVPFGKKGLTWRVAFTPFFNGDGLLPWFGASLGYRF